MTTFVNTPGLRRVRAVVLVCAALIVGGCSGPGQSASTHATSSSSPPASTDTPAASPSALPATPDSRAAAVPVRIAIDRLGVLAPVEAVGERPDGQVESPHEWGDTAWFRDGYAPGTAGNAVILGHLDTDQASHPEAVFWRLNELQPGDPIVVTRADGTALTFHVTSEAVFGLDAFPTAEVFGPADHPVLRLLTCTGVWRGQARGYDHRLVVTAEE